MRAPRGPLPGAPGAPGPARSLGAPGARLPGPRCPGLSKTNGLFRKATVWGAMIWGTLEVQVGSRQFES